MDNGPEKHVSGSSRTYLLVIPGWQPCLTNELIGRHWGKISGLKKRDVEQLARARLVYGVPAARGPRRVGVTIWGAYGTLPDPDAPLKSFQDALKRSGLIVDDSAQYLTLDWPPQFRRGPKQTIVRIEDL